MSDNTRSEWINDSDGVQGVVIFDEDGKRGGAAVKPGQTIWLTEKERIATANAPNKPIDNPFANGAFRCVTPATEVKSRRPIGAEGAQPETPVATPAEPTFEVEVAKGVKVPMTAAQKAAFDKAQDEAAKPREERPATEEVGAPPLPEGDPERGVRAPGEEVGSPEVVKQSGTAARVKTGRGVTVDSSSPLASPTPAEGVPTGVVMTPAGPKLVEAQ